MGFSDSAGYSPASITDLMGIVMENVNTQFGTSYDAATFLGTNFYKFFYAAIQRLQENEVKTAEIFLKLQEYFNITNEKILRPNTTAPGIVDYLLASGYTASVKPPEAGDEGKLYICVDTDEDDDDYAATKLAICTLIKDCAVGGVITQGSEVETITLSNAQGFDFKYSLPTRIPTSLKLTVTLSENNEFTIDTPEVQIANLLANIAAKYKFGKNFEPQRYFTVLDAPWASEILLEYDIGGGFIHSVFEADFDEVLTFDVEDVELVET